ncbi:MAG: RHS repeat-associated core domain-containing protein [Flavobacteriales bacterium]|nr:RHS repeat-associated core domain-containing protein [Flavobacteriales bacterium]
MFQIKNNQLDVFRVPLRAKAREKFLAQLQSNGYEKIYETENSVHILDSKKRKSVLDYSEKNLLSQFTKPTGVKSKFTYDEEDRLSQIELATKETLNLKYKDELPKSININGAILEIVYTAKSQISEIVFPDKKSVRFQYGENDKLISITNRAGETQFFNTTIIDGKLIHQLKDSLGRQIQFTMDSFGGMEKILLPDGTSQEVSYNEDLDAEVVKLRNGKTKTIYSGELYLERIEWEDGSFQDIKLNEKLQVQSIENSTGIISYEYDEYGRPLSESYQESKVIYIYDNELLKKIIYPSGLKVTYEYNEDDELQSVKIGDKEINYQYNADGTLSQINYPNGINEEQKNFVFSGLQKSRLINKSGSVISEQTYSYDELGRLKTLHDLEKNTARDWQFEYDAEHRLTSAKENNQNNYEKYSYDAKGNIIQANEIKIEIGLMDEVKRLGNNLLEYDKAGNLSGFNDDNNRKFKFKFSENNTLKHALINNETWEYWYDGLGRRVGKSNGNEAYKYFWAGDKLLSEEYSKADLVINREYIYTDSNVPVAFIEGNKIYYFQKDVRGAIIRVHDERGEIVWSASYTAFGKANISIEKIKQPWRLAGQYFDNETGLHYNLARYYSPYLRSFLSLDPKWILFGANNYSYAANDPYNKIDTDGNWPEWLNTKNVLSVGAGIVAGVATAAAAVAVAGAIGISAPVIAGSLVALVIIGAISGFVAGATESIVSDLMDHKDIFIACALKSGLWGAAIGAVLGPVLKLASGPLGALGRGIGAKIVKIFPSLGKWAKGLAQKEAKKAAEKILKSGRSKSKLPRAVSVAVDKKTGKVYTGESGRVKPPRTDLHPELEQRMPKESLERHSPDNCAEVDAANEALKDGAKIEDLEIHTVKIEKNTGVVSDFEPCNNCQQTFEGVEMTSKK